MTVPGAVREWLDLPERFGSRTFASVAAEAVAVARDGVTLSPAAAGLIPRSPPSTDAPSPSTGHSSRQSLWAGRAPHSGRGGRRLDRRAYGVTDHGVDPKGSRLAPSVADAPEPRTG
jgi:hypothetical protein